MREVEERIAENVVKLLEGEDDSRQGAKGDNMKVFLRGFAPLRERDTAARELEERIAENVMRLLEE
ncbi:MAG: hypothetical protein HY318_01155 [Armatimonadetes bacterium]|nr:hypothetical protein [Armatimonadota bacterium]